VIFTNQHKISLDYHFLRSWPDMVWVQFLKMFVHGKLKCPVKRTEIKNIAPQNTVATALVDQ